MGSAVDFDSAGDFVDAYVGELLETGIWNGRIVSWQEAPAFSEEVALRILNLFLSQDPNSLDFNQLAAYLARLGTTDATSLALLEKDIVELKLDPNGMVIQAGLGKWMSKCWHKHKAAIIVGIAVAAIAATMIVVTVCSGGAAAGAAAGVAAGMASKDDKPAKKSSLNPDETISQPPSTPSPAIEKPSSSAPATGTPFTFLENGVQIGEQVVPYTSFVEQMQREGIMPRPSPNPEPSWLTQVITKKTPWGNEIILPDQDNQPAWVTKPIPNPGSELPKQAIFSAPSILPREVLDPKIPSARELFTPTALPLIGQPGQNIIHTYCGIANDKKSVMEGGVCLHKQLGGDFAVQPNWIHNESLPYGLAMVGLEKIFADPTPADALCWGGLICLRNLIMNHSDIQDSVDFLVYQLSTTAQQILTEKNPSLKQVVVTFSNAGHVCNEALKIIPPEYRQTVIVVTAGSTAIIEKSLACKVYNIIGDKDWPSKFCNGGEAGLAEAKKVANIEIIEQTETMPGISGHYFVQPDYQDRIAHILTEKVFPDYETK